MVSDVRYAVRGLLRAPGVAVIAVAALALGVGLTTLMFSIVYGTMYRGLPFRGGDRIMSLYRADPTRDVVREALPAHDFLDYRERQRSFEDLAAFYERTVVLTVGEVPERYAGAVMTGSAMEDLGEAPSIGRLITEEDTRPGAAPVVVLGFLPWRDLFGSDPGVVGRVVRVDGSPATVIGVMPPGYRFPSNHHVWVPLRIDPTATSRGEGRGYNVFGRLAEGVSIDRATRDLNRIAGELAVAYPESNAGFVPVLAPYERGSMDDDSRTAMLTMLAAAGMVLLIACANVANLLLARAAVRTRDVAVRVSLGASRLRVVSQTMAESLVLALAGAALGALVAWVGIEIFTRAVAADPPPFWMTFRLDAPILAFVVLVCGIAAVASGAIPALRASRGDLNAVLKDESRGSSSLRIGRLSRVLVVAEVAMSLALLVGAGMMMRGAWALDRRVFPYPTEDVLTARIVLAQDRFPDGASRTRFWQRLEDRIGALPGVRSVGVVEELPGLGSPRAGLQIEGATYASDREIPQANWARVSPGFFAALDARPVRGRAFTSGDDATTAPVAIVNESFARARFPAESPLGRRIRIGGLESGNPWREIVGVVPDLDMRQLDDPADQTAGVYVPIAQDPQYYASLVVRAKDPLTFTEAVRRAVSATDADTPIFLVDTLRGRITGSLWFYGVFGTLFSAFGAAALFMASVGLYGVMAFSVTARIPEIGIRMALGAQRGQVRTLVLRSGMTQVGIGLALGSALALLVARGLRVLILDQRVWDPAMHLLVLSVLALTGLAACAIPALRATRVDPSHALRAE